MFHIQKLILRGNDLGSLEDYSFSMSFQIQNIQTFLTVVPEKQKNFNNKIYKLQKMDYNGMKHIKDGAFAALLGFEFLSLVGNNLRSLQPDTFPLFFHIYRIKLGQFEQESVAL